MSSAAENLRRAPSDGEAILNALPNPVLLIAPDGKIVDANIAANRSSRFRRNFYSGNRCGSWCRSAALCWR